MTIYNPEHYADPTAHDAINNVLNERKEKEMLKVYPGDVAKATLNNGNEKIFLVLAVHNNTSSVLMLSEDDTLPVGIKCDRMMYCNPALVQFTYNDLFYDLIRTLSEAEFAAIKTEVSKALGLAVNTAATAPNDDVVKLSAERDIYKNLYNDLLSSLLSRGKTA